MSVVLIAGIAVCWYVIGNMGFRFWESRGYLGPNHPLGWGIAVLGPVAWLAGLTIPRPSR